MFACCLYYSRLPLSLIFIHTTCISLSLRRTSAPIHLTSVLGVLGTQETFCILIAGLLERNIFDLYFPEFDKPWVIHLRETCCCSTNLCTWRPNTVYKSQAIFWCRSRGTKEGEPPYSPPPTHRQHFSGAIAALIIILPPRLSPSRVEASVDITNLLTRCHSASSCFLLLYFRKVIQE